MYFDTNDYSLVCVTCLVYYQYLHYSYYSTLDSIQHYSSLENRTCKQIQRPEMSEDHKVNEHRK